MTIVDSALPRLRLLADEVNEKHTTAEAIGRDWLEVATAIGQSLIEAQSLVEPGEWEQWAEENLHFGVAAARAYMRIAFHARTLTGKAPATLTEALTMLRGQPPIRGKGGRLRWPAPSPELVDHVRALRARGDGWDNIGRQVGSTGDTVRAWIDPEFRQRRTEQFKRATRRARAGRRALDRQQKDELARRSGDSLGSAYSLVRRALLDLDRALAESAEGAHAETRTAIRNAITHAHSLDDSIVAALRGKADMR